MPLITQYNQLHKHRTLRKMEKDAKMFGYKLVKEGENE